MPELRVTLRHRRGEPRATRAWYLVGGTPDAWLEEISRWPTAQASLRIVPIATSLTDRSTVGALALPGSADFEASPRCIAYAQATERLYVPVDADPFPALDESELSALFAGDYVYVWCPGAGLVACDESSILRVHELVEPWPRGSRRWDRATPGVAHPHRLTQVAPHGDLTARDILEDGRDDIATEQPALDNLPASPGEPKSGLWHAISRKAAWGVASCAYALTRLVPKTDGGPTWVDKVEAFARRKLESVHQALEHSRYKELSRLLDLLQRDPDRGLRFALSFGGGDHRGRTRPSGHLAEREADFNLDRIAGGHAADVWDVPLHYQNLLRERYRELANREIRLGRYRRAAYIYAELLGDFESAASTLVRGGHFREAAVLYRERLGRRLDAASCLAQGGLLTEAIALYAEIEQHEKVGDLYQQLDQPDAAAEAYQRAAGRFRSQGDFVSAARVFEEKLADPPQAVAELEAGWPNSPQAIECLRSLFALLGRHGRHKAAAGRATKLPLEAQQHGLHIPVAQLLSDLSGAYPDANVREKTVEAAKRVIGARLRHAAESEAAQLASALVKLAPEDRLLARDARRFVSCRSTSTPRSTRPRDRELTLVLMFDLGLPGAWQTAVANGNTIFAAGLVDNRIVLARCDFAGNCERALTPWPRVPIYAGSRLVLAAPGEQLGVYAFGPGMDDPLLEQRPVFPASDRFPTAVTAGTLTGTGNVCGVAQTYNHTLVAKYGTGLVLVMLDAYGNPVSTQSLPLELTQRWFEEPLFGDAWYDLCDVPTFPLPLHARRDRIYVGFGTNMLVLQSSQQTRRFEFPEPIRAICGTAWNTLTRVAIALDVGAYLLWDHYGHHDLRAFAQDMEQPVVGFNRGGFVIAASTTGLEVYDTKGGELTLVTQSAPLPADPVSILSAPQTDQFAILTRSGKVYVFQI